MDQEDCMNPDLGDFNLGTPPPNPLNRIYEDDDSSLDNESQTLPQHKTPSLPVSSHNLQTIKNPFGATLPNSTPQIPDPTSSTIKNTHNLQQHTPITNCNPNPNPNPKVSHNNPTNNAMNNPNINNISIEMDISYSKLNNNTLAFNDKTCPNPKMHFSE